MAAGIGNHVGGDTDFGVIDVGCELRQGISAGICVDGLLSAIYRQGQAAGNQVRRVCKIVRVIGVGLRQGTDDHGMTAGNGTIAGGGELQHAGVRARPFHRGKHSLKVRQRLQTGSQIGQIRSQRGVGSVFAFQLRQLIVPGRL